MYFSSKKDKDAADLKSHLQLKKSDAELYKHLIDDGVIHHKKTETKISAKPMSTIGDAYKTGELLGSGGYGSVYSGTRIADGRPVAIKIVKKTKISHWKSFNGYNIPMEAYLNLQLGPVDGAVKMLDYYEMSTSCVLVFEKPEECMDLFDYISKEKMLSEPLARHFMVQVINTLIQCEQQGVIHRDIKDENLIVDLVKNQVRLIDFGSGSTVKDDKYMEYNGTQVFAPPEFIREGWYFGEGLTVWSLGALLFNMVTGNIPFHNDEQILAGDFQFKNKVSDHCQHLIRWCLSQTHTDRPTMNQILQHPWIDVSY